jgi:hypothetical protein
MTAKDQLKVIKKGFIVIRPDDQPSLRVKFKDRSNHEWTTLGNFKTKAERDKYMNDLLSQPNVIQD